MVEQPLIIPISATMYRLVQDYHYDWTHDGVQQRLYIPTGFEYDGLSVPRIAWTISGLQRDGLGRAAALLHDSMYRFCGKLPAGWHTEYRVIAEVTVRRNVTTPWTREQADRLFGRVMRESEVSIFQRRAAYLSIRAMGWLWWKE